MSNHIDSIGCSMDGLLDRSYSQSRGLVLDRFYLSDVIIPSHSFGTILTGRAAEQSRIASGFDWPPEAQLLEANNDKPRRVPVAWAWRMLIDSGAEPARWTIGGGHSIRVADLIAAHIIGKLSESYSGTTVERLIVSIPNDLNEYGQECLLRALDRRGIRSIAREVKLVWRPIAAALALIERKKRASSLRENDLTMVVHLGPDAIEIATFPLRPRKSNGKTYLVPLRAEGGLSIPYCGCDWAYQLSDLLAKDGADDKASWQVFTDFPEPWLALADKVWDDEALPRPWFKDGAWVLWNPRKVDQAQIFEISVARNHFLAKCSNYIFQSEATTWKEYFKEAFKTVASGCAGKRLSALAFTGPIGGARFRNWAVESIKRCMNTDDLFVVNSDDECDLVSEGSAIYGERLKTGEPTYLDTLPMLSMMADHKGQRIWVPLLRKENTEIEGGRVATFTVEDAGLSLKAGSKEVQGYLKRGDPKEVRKIRGGTIRFPYSPEKSVKVVPQIRVASANGLAQVELVPDDASFLKDAHVFFDYAYMNEIDEDKLPPPLLAYPKIRKILVQAIAYTPQTVKEFLQTSINSNRYLVSATSVRDFVRGSLKKGRYVNADGEAHNETSAEVIKQLSEKLNNDLKEIFECEYLKYRRAQQQFLKICGISKWLFGATPSRLLDAFRDDDCVIPPSILGAFIGAVGNAAVDVGDLRRLFKDAVEAAEEARSNGAVIQTYWIRAVYQSLALRPQAATALSERLASALLICVIEKMEAQAAIVPPAFKATFMESAGCLLVLLRYREIDNKFLDPSRPEDLKTIKRAKKVMGMAKNYILPKKPLTWVGKKTCDILEEIEKYIDRQGTKDLLPEVEKVVELTLDEQPQ